MAASAKRQVFFSERAPDALVASLIKNYKNVSSRILGRIILQKLCYFAKASGAPLPFRFEIYHYGPFSQEIFDVAERLLLDGVIEDRSSDPAQSNYIPGPNFERYLNQFGDAIDQHETKLKRIAEMFSLLDPSQMELVSTIHYLHSSHREWFKETPSKQRVVASVLEVKGNKFGKDAVEKAYDILRDAGLLS